MSTQINPHYCKGCNLCVAICPKEVYQEGEEPSVQGYIVPLIACPEKCLDAGRKPGEKLRCQLCVLECPDQAITWENE
ncbi:ferredoxin family protein [Candidatus Zixiibacteriota bacterium]